MCLPCRPSPEMLPLLLGKPEVALKYTIEALQKTSWPVPRPFPRDWLRQCLPAAQLRHGRADALTFLFHNGRGLVQVCCERK
jgi:hypothetical protein